MARTVFLVVVPLVLAPGLLAQANNESRGPLAGAATAVLVQNGLVASGDAQTRVHRNGFDGSPTLPLPASPGGHDLLRVFQQWNGPLTIHVDDISSGRDDVPVDATGLIALPPQAWSVLSFSLRTGATGLPASGTNPPSRIAREALLGDIGAALFSWVMPGSNLPPQQVGRVERSHSGRELGLPALGLEVDAVDFPIMLGRDQGGLLGREPGFVPLIAAPESIYFTVSHATRDQVPAFWWGPGTITTLRSGATIFVTSRTTSGGWGQPTVFKHYYELGLLQNEDIDGLAYDEVRQTLLFSCVGTTRDQFLFLDNVTDGGPPAPIPLRTTVQTPNGPVQTPVSTQVGKGQNDDVDAVCTLDPGILTNNLPPSGGDDFGSSCGAPRPGLLGVPTVHASAFRRFQAGQVFYDTWMVGWPPVAGPAPGFAALFVTVGNNPTLIPAGPILLRDSTPTMPGDPQSYALVVPPAFALSNTVLTFRWVALDFATAELAEAWPVQVFL